MLLQVDYFILLMGRPLWINDEESACNAEDTGSIPGSGMATHSSTLAWRILWTGESGVLHSPWGCKESDTTELSNIPLYTCY